MVAPTTARDLVGEAVRSVSNYRRSFSVEVIHKLELAYVSQWLLDQSVASWPGPEQTAIVALHRLRDLQANALMNQLPPPWSEELQAVGS